MFSNHFKIALRFTLITTVLFGVVYPLVMTGYARIADHEKADGQLIESQNTIVGSRIIGQAFVSSRYFHGRPSAAGNGYDATSSGGSNLGLSSQKLVARIDQDTKTASAENAGVPVPAELVEASGSGLDPDISPAAALFQVSRVASARHSVCGQRPATRVEPYRKASAWLSWRAARQRPDIEPRTGRERFRREITPTQSDG